MEIKEMYFEIERRIRSVDFDRLWKGFREYPFAIYNDREVCFKGQLMPKTDEFIANTAIKYNDEWIAIFMVEGNENLDMMASKLIHEMFHAFQNSKLEGRQFNFPSELDVLMKYEYTPSNLAGKLYENRLLVSLIKDGFSQEKWEDLLISKRHRLEKHEYSYKYEAGIEETEGAANYVELKSLQQINEKMYKEKLEKMIKSLEKVESLIPIRIGLYDSGALLIKLLFDQGIDFNQDFSGVPFSLSILDGLAFKEVSYPEDKDLEKFIEGHYQDLDELIDRISKNPPTIEGSFELLGFNAYNAKYHRAYVYTTYFLAYIDGGEDKFLYGDFLFELDEGRIVRIYRDE